MWQKDKRCFNSMNESEHLLHFRTESLNQIIDRYYGKLLIYTFDSHELISNDLNSV